MSHPTRDELEAGVARVREAPHDAGVVEMIVARPGPGAREVLAEGRIDVDAGLVGDRWSSDEDRDPEAQITLMASRVIALLAGQKDRWPLAGDQIFVDLDLSETNLPTGSRLAVGSALLEITALPHTGCAQFGAWFGSEALAFVNGPSGRELRLRGVNARVLRSGVVRVGDEARKEPA